jgi:hypothetical protein
MTVFLARPTGHPREMSLEESHPPPMLPMLVIV